MTVDDGIKCLPCSKRSNSDVFYVAKSRKVFGKNESIGKVGVETLFECPECGDVLIHRTLQKPEEVNEFG